MLLFYIFVIMSVSWQKLPLYYEAKINNKLSSCISNLFFVSVIFI